MPPEQTVTDALAGGAVNSADPNGEGKNREQQEAEIKIRENLRAEYERKAKQDIEKAKKELESSFDGRVAEKIKELERKKHLTSGEERDLEVLRAIKENPDSGGWRKFFSEIAQESNKEAITEIQKLQAAEDYEDALDMVKEFADENNLDFSKFKEEINELVPMVKGKINSVRPTKIVKFAIKEWKKQQEALKTLKEAEEIRKNPAQFAESQSGRVTRKATTGEEMKKARETGDFSAVLRKTLGEVK